MTIIMQKVTPDLSDGALPSGSAVASQLKCSVCGGVLRESCGTLNHHARALLDIHFRLHRIIGSEGDGKSTHELIDEIVRRFMISASATDINT